MKKSYVIIGILAVLALVVYNLVPSPDFRENVYPLQDGVKFFAFDDQADGGSSRVETAFEDGSVSFSCTLGQDTTKWAWCGTLWNFDPENKGRYRNWTLVDSVILDMDVQNTEGILLKLWTFEPSVTDTAKSTSFKLLMKEVPVVTGRQRVALPIEDLYTPDFWFEKAGVDKSLNQRHQEYVARLEIAPGWNHPRGKEFSVSFREIYAKGRSNIPFGILLGFYLVLMIVAIGFKNRTKNDDSEK